MRLNKCFSLLSIASLASLTTIACAAPTEDEGAAANEDAVTASSCQVFVDKATISRSSHGLHGYRLFLKTLNDKLDGKVTRVGFHAVVHDLGGRCQGDNALGYMNGCEDVGRWRDYFAQSFVGAGDYFEMDLTLGHDFTFPHQFEGVFFVETDKGTRYWHKAAAGQNFFLDHTGFDHVESALRSKGVSWWDADVGRLPKTADFYSYLNPTACR